MSTFVRIAPSPTGYLHVGNIRTALVNWLFARRTGGRFLLRLDDTDQERSRPEFAAAIAEDMRWLGLEWDDFKKQSDRFADYAAAQKKLVESGRLYPCYETQEELDIRRKMQAGRGLPPIYDRASLSLSDAQKAQYEKEGRKPHYRFLLESKPIEWNDLVRGEVRYLGGHMSDPVLVREDGVPLYTLASVVDDGDMGITHVIRGEDHVSNTAVQVQIFEALGFKVPKFAHLALLKTKDGEMSKRVGGNDIRSLREAGIEPMAINSLLARIGTSAAVEPFAELSALVATFDFSKFGRAPAIYDSAELERLNGKLLHQLPFDAVAKQLGFGDEQFWLSVRANVQTLSEVRQWWDIVHGAHNYKITDAAFCKAAAELLPEEPWDETTWGAWTKAISAATGRKGKELFLPLRLALTGMEHGPEMKSLLPMIPPQSRFTEIEPIRMSITLYNTLTRSKEIFTPADPNNVSMYVCGPTVYDRAHLGNARSVVVYDVLYRLLIQVYGHDHVTYARNITDVDDKIVTAATQRKITISELTLGIIEWFHSDIGALGVLPASQHMVEPKATEHIPQMIEIIQKLIAGGHAYVAQGHVLFSVASMPAYGALSGRIQDDLEAGARVKVEGYKKAPGDFVLWKPSDAGDTPSSVFDSPWGKGRPGWHIECSAMSHTHLGNNFDIHGGGADLMFPHHENEIAQSKCAFPGSTHAKYWVHNGFLTVNGEKMSKSLGNFITVRDLLDKGVKGEVIRYALLKTKYREPLDWNDKLMEDAKKDLDGFYRKIMAAESVKGNADYIAILSDDLNVPAFAAELHKTPGKYLKHMGALLGILQQDPESWFKGGETTGRDDSATQALIDARIEAKKTKNWGEADRIRNELKSQGIVLEDKPDGSTDWRRE